MVRLCCRSVSICGKPFQSKNGCCICGTRVSLSRPRRWDWRCSVLASMTRARFFFFAAHNPPGASYPYASDVCLCACDNLCTLARLFRAWSRRRVFFYHQSRDTMININSVLLQCCVAWANTHCVVLFLFLAE